MLDLSRDGFTHEQIIKALHSSNRQIDFRYELLDFNNRTKKDLRNVLSAEVSQNMLANIKRTARFSIAEDSEIDYLNDRIKPYMRLWIPEPHKRAREFTFISHVQPIELKNNEALPKSGWADFPLGIFLLSSPTRRDKLTVIRDVEAFDLSLILRDDKLTERLAILEGTLVYDAVVGVLTGAGVELYNIERSEEVLTRTIEWETGTEKYQVVNDLLNMINYTPIHVDENGFFVSYKYRTPSERSSNYEYADNSVSVVFPEVEEELDLFSVPNTFTVVRTNEEEEPLVSTFVNDNPNSPTSTVSRGRVISEHREIDDIVSQEALNEYVARIAFETSQIYGRIKFQSALMPFHGYADVLDFSYSPLTINGKYLELSWRMILEVGGKMEHELRQIVDVGGVEIPNPEEPEDPGFSDIPLNPDPGLKEPPEDGGVDPIDPPKEDMT